MVFKHLLCARSSSLTQTDVITESNAMKEGLKFKESEVLVQGTLCKQSGSGLSSDPSTTFVFCGPNPLQKGFSNPEIRLKKTKQNRASMNYSNQHHEATLCLGILGLFLFVFVFVCLFVLLFRATPEAYGSSQASGLNQSCSWWPMPQSQQLEIRAASEDYTTAHGNARSLAH